MNILDLNENDKIATVSLNDSEFKAMKKILNNETVGFSFVCFSDKGYKESYNKIKGIIDENK